MKPSDVVYESEIFSRVTEVQMQGKKFVTPTYFPAISTYGIKYSFGALLRLLTAHSYPRLLISAYDFHLLDGKKRRQLAHEVDEYSKRGCFVFLDSGIYESFWKADSRWTYDLYRTSISQITFDFYCSFDILPYAKDRTEEFVRDTFDSILASRDLSDTVGFVPILHAKTPGNLISLVRSFTKTYPNLCNFIAVTERDCGNNIMEKARTILEIRKALDNVDRGSILHILGCGNPTSIILLSFCGANMFDSLDWIRYVIDQNRLSIDDFSHLELTNCECAVCSGRKRNYIEKVMLHNLYFYQNFMLRVQSLIRRNEISEFLGECIGQDIVKKTKDFRA